MRLLTVWCTKAPDADGESTRKTRGHGWALLCDAVLVVGHDVAVEESLGLLGAPLPNDISDTSLRARALSVHSTAKEADLSGRVAEFLGAGRSILWEQQLNLRGSTGSAFDWPVAEAVRRAARQIRSRYPPLTRAAYLYIGP